MKVISFFRAAVTTCAFVLSAHAGAAPILLVDDNGILTGAKGVDVSGRLYNVTFADGTCAELFNGCNPATFAFQDQYSAKAAVYALFNQVLVDGPMGNFDSSPNKVRGCEKYIYACSSLIPYDLSTSGDNTFVWLFAAFNHRFESGPFGPNDIVTAGGIQDRSTAADDEVNPRNYAIFELAPPASSVPEPASIALMGLAMAGLAFSRRRKS